MFFTVPSILLKGLEGRIISIEIDIGRGMPGFTIIGLASPSIQEAKSRMRSALRNCGYAFPYDQRVLVNLAPADQAKEGSYFDLAMACGLALARQNPSPESIAELASTLLLGELGLQGEIKAVRLVCPLVRAARDLGFKRIIISDEDKKIASYFTDTVLLPAKNLVQVVEHFLGVAKLEPIQGQKIALPQREPCLIGAIRGQYMAKRALVISAVGGHHTVLAGPPGAGKTLLASQLVSLLPDLTLNEDCEVESLYSMAGLGKDRSGASLVPPLRSPHHTASLVSLIGGGPLCMPGEVSLANCGVLFLDEILEFPRQTVEALRQPLESGVVHISRARGHVVYPSRFLLIAAHNPCQCGFFGSQDHACTCTLSQVTAYQRRMSGPFLDRISLFVQVARVPESELITPLKHDSSHSIQEGETMKSTVIKAREFRTARAVAAVQSQGNGPASLPSQYGGLNDLPSSLQPTFSRLISSFNLSARGAMNILKVSRTIADIEQSEEIKEEHVLEAAQYRKPQNAID